MRRVTSSLLAACAVLVSVGCAKVDLKMAVDVVSEPAAAEVVYKGKALGATPQAVNVNTFDELMSIAAKQGDKAIAEKRIRIVAPDKAQLIFRFGDEKSALAKKLGLANVMVFDYSEKVAFDSGKSELKPDALPILNKQADILNKYFPNVDVYVCGHTDNTGGADLNLNLSLKRSQVVTDYLVARGVPKPRLKSQGFGADYPSDTNATAAGRATNRRTELVLPQ